MLHLKNSIGLYQRVFFYIFVEKKTWHPNLDIAFPFALIKSLSESKFHQDKLNAALMTLRYARGLTTTTNVLPGFKSAVLKDDVMDQYNKFSLLFKTASLYIFWMFKRYSRRYLKYVIATVETKAGVLECWIITYWLHIRGLSKECGSALSMPVAFQYFDWYSIELQIMVYE